MTDVTGSRKNSPRKYPPEIISQEKIPPDICPHEKMPKMKFLKKLSPCFPDDLKLVEVYRIFQKNNDLDKENYRSASVLSHMSDRVQPN